jgi:oligoendopeptidase F
MTDKQTIPERSEIPDELKWDIERIYADWQTWESDVARVEALIPDLEALKGTIGESGAALLGALDAIMAAHQSLEMVYVYAALKSDQDTRIGENLANRGSAGTLAVSLSEAVSWLEPELLAIDETRLAELVAEEPGLAIYAHYLDDIGRRRAHTLSDREEALLASAGNITRGAGNVFSALNNADLKFPEIRDENGDLVELTKARYSRFVRSRDRGVRESAFLGMMQSYSKVINTLAANMDACVKNHVFYARARNHEGTLQAALHSNAVPEDVFHSLIATVNENLPHVHRYTALKKRVLKLGEIREHDLYVPLFPEGEFTYSYDEAREHMLASLQPLGEDYLKIVREGLDNRWIDVHENAGKRSGAYSSGVFNTDPYILLNWSDQLRDTFTLAHEMGHSVHSWLASHNQPYVYADYPIFTAEVASTFNEMLLMRHLLENTTDRGRKLYLLDFFLDMINSTVFRQTMFAEFEYLIHRLGEDGETLTAELLDRKYLEILQRYWGPLLSAHETHSARTWCRIPHFYYNYYVYQYATAFAASAALSQRVLDGGDREREDYLGFMRSGCSRYPVETLRTAGVDVTTAQPVAAVFDLFVQLMDQFEALLD